jgi:tetratricopeptide (TPR) repeat protein
MNSPNETIKDPKVWAKWLYNGDPKKIIVRLNHIRCTAPYSVQRSLSPEIMRSLLAGAVVGHLSQKTYSQLQALRLQLDWNDDWVVEVMWNFAVFRKYSAQLQEVLKLRDDIDAHLLLGRLSDAATCISKMKAAYGCSLWTLEREFMLAQYRGGFQANKEFLSEVHEGKGSAFVLYLATLFSMRIEQESIPAYYEKVLKQKVYSVWTDPHDRVREYLSTYAEPFRRSPCEQKAYCIWRDNNGSLIDRYTQVIKVIRKACCIGLSSEDSGRIKILIAELMREVSDPALQSIQDLLESDDLRTRSSALSKEFLAGLDLYTIGRYADAQTACIKMLQSYPHDFGLYELTAKCAVHDRRVPPNVTEDDSLANRIINHLVIIFGEEASYHKAERALQTIAQQLGEKHLAIGIYAVLDRLARGCDRYTSRLAQYYTGLHNPGACLAAGGDMTGIVNSYPDNVTCDFLMRRASASLSTTSNDRDIDWYRWNLAVGRELVILNKGDEALQLLEKIKERCSNKSLEIPNCILATCIELKFDALRAKGQVMEALRVLADEYIANKNLVRRLAVADFLSEIGKPPEKTVMVSIEYLFARAIIAESAQDAYESLDDFLLANAFSRPRDVLAALDRFDVKRCVYAIVHVFRRDVMSRGPYCSTTDELAEERLFLLNAVGALGPSKTIADIRAELSELHKEMLIRAASHHVNEGRIAVQFDSIRDAVDVIRPYFDRYKSLKQAEENANIESIPLENIRPDKEGTPLSTPPLQPVQESIAAFNEVCLLVLVDLCLLSEHYGLDGRLSARIRHGALSNIIRSPFEEGALVTRKSVSRDSYVPSKFWQTIFKENDANDDAIRSFDSAQITFTKSIDGIVSELQANLLQIRLPNFPQLQVILPQYTGKPRGMFNYSMMFDKFGEYEREIGRNCATVEEAIDQLIGAFTAYTSELLVSIRDHIQRNTQRELRELIDKFGSDVRSLSLPAKANNKFSDELAKSRTQLQTMINQLTSWFHFKSPTSYPDYPLNVTYEAVLSAINDCSNGRLEKAISDVPDIRCKGTYFHAVYDILFTLLYNVVEHSDLEKSDIGLQVKCSVVEGHFRLTISNKVNMAKDIASLVEDANKLIASTPAEGLGRSSGEGRSGFLKIRNILVRDLQRKSWLITAAAGADNRFLVDVSCEADGLFGQ